MNSDEPQTIHGYIPPKSYAFSSMAEALGHFISALCSAECARYLLYVDTHPTKKDSHLSQFLSAYTLADWAVGKIEETMWVGRETMAKEALQRWALSMIEFNTLFRSKGIDDPAQFVEEKLMVRRVDGRYGWQPVIENIDTLLGFDLGSVDVSHHILLPAAGQALPVPPSETVPAAALSSESESASGPDSGD